MYQAVSPTTGEVLREIAEDDEQTVEAKLERARAAFSDWRRRPATERGAILRGCATALRERTEELATLITDEMGKPIREARGEIGKSAWVLEHYADHGPEYLLPEPVAADASRAEVRHLPLGPILGVMPWNSPFWLTFRYAAPALMAGNVGLLKHAAGVPGCASRIPEVLREAGLPDGVFQDLMLHPPGIEQVLRDDRVAGVSLTGSTRAGSAVAAVAGAEIKHVVLELGGSDPFVVLGDADVEEAAEVAALSRMINAGQSCIAAKRMLVESAVHDRFVQRVEERMRELRMGDPRSEDTDVGPLARRDLRDEVHDQVRRTVEAGATCRLGGQVPERTGWFYPPTLLTEVTSEMPAFREETFGPVGCVTRVADADEALALANDSAFGLGASLWTTRERGARLAEELEAGHVAVNGIVKTDPRLPTGGIKRSGLGRELGYAGIQEFVNRQALWLGPKVGD